MKRTTITELELLALEVIGAISTISVVLFATAWGIISMYKQLIDFAAK